MRKRHAALAAFALACGLFHAAEAAQAGAARLVPGAGIALPDCPAFSPVVLDYNWKRHGPVGSAESFAIECAAAPLENVSDGALRFTGSAAFRETGDGCIDAIWRIAPERDGDFQTACVMAQFPKSRFGGGVRAGGIFVPVPEGVPPSPHLFTGKVKSLEFLAKDGAPWLAVAFPEGCDVLVQDDMRWGKQRMTIRFAFVHNHAEAGREYTVHAVFRIPGKSLAIAEDTPLVMAAGPDWIPCPAPPDGTDWIEPGSALDFSAVIPHHSPAGKFGRVVAVGDHFELEGRPGEPFRLCGANLCGQANFPAPEDADRFAANIARLGYNTLRIHHHEVHFVSPETRKPVGDGRGLDVNPNSWRRFDALVAACVRHGLYLSTDLFVARSKAIDWRAIGIDRDGPVPFRTFKLLAAFHEPAYSNLVEWTRVFLSHVNPHTGRSLAEEPALATLALINEGNLGNDNVQALAIVPGVEEAWGAPFPRDVYGGEEDHDIARFALFLAEREEALFDRLSREVRALGCRAPLSNLSSWYFPVQYLLPMSRFDFIENHFYLDHPQFLTKQWKYPSAIIGENPFRSGSNIPAAAWRRVFGKPFCISEWNWAAPCPYRVSSGLSVGALAALQGWSGLWRFAWGHDRAAVASPGSLPMKYFDLHSDPAALASERATLMLFLRGDMAPLPPERAAPAVWDEKALRSGETPALRLGAPMSGVSPWERLIGAVLEAPHSMSLCVGLTSGGGAVRRLPCGGALAAPAPNGAFRVVTPRTCGGFAESGTLGCGPLCFDILPASAEIRGAASPPSFVSAVPAAIWASSLNGEPLVSSSRILVAHVTDARNTGAVFDDDTARTWHRQGRTPALVRRGLARVSIFVQGGEGAQPPSFAVFRLSPTGRRVAKVPSSIDPCTGRLSFVADTAYDTSCATVFYEIARSNLQ